MIAGIDEAGRGSLIGPLVIALVVFPLRKEMSEEEREVVEKLRDSKVLSKGKREELFEEIKKHFPFFYTKVTPKQIDATSINKLEERKAKELLDRARKRFRIDRVYVDAFEDKEKLEKALGGKVVAEEKADRKYRVVSAASIVAKVVRDRAIEKLKEKYGDFGSGYPADERTRKFVEEHYDEIKDHVRKKWKTLEKLRLSPTLGDYLK